MDQSVSPPVVMPKPSAAAPRDRRILFGAALLMMLLLVAIGTWWATHREAPVRYATVPIARGAVTRAVTATGTVNPVLTIIVGTYVSGVIKQLYCDYNTSVKQGQICAKIDPRPYQAVLDQYSGQLARDRAILEKDQSDLARYQKLAQQDSIAHQQADDQAYVVHQDEGTVQLDEGLVEAAKLNLGYTDIVSPVDGTVVSRAVTPGQTVAATLQTPTLFLIATDLTQMEVDTNVSESDIGPIQQSNSATFTVDAWPGRVFSGPVVQVRQSPQTVQNVVTYDVVVSVDNKDLALKPGMTASTQIVTDRRADVLRVPDQALRYTPSGVAAAEPGAARLWVARDGKPVAIPVVPGLDDDSFTEIVSGTVQAGDLVITGEQRGAAHSAAPAPRL
jgi:HlyD family secretion protein